MKFVMFGSKVSGFQLNTRHIQVWMLESSNIVEEAR